MELLEEECLVEPGRRRERRQEPQLREWDRERELRVPDLDDMVRAGLDDLHLDVGGGERVAREEVAREEGWLWTSQSPPSLLPVREGNGHRDDPRYRLPIPWECNLLPES